MKKQDFEIKLNKMELNISEILTEISNQNAEIEFNPDDPFSKQIPSKLVFSIFWDE